MAVSMDVALSGQLALARRLDTIAHNVANATSAGFRAEAVRFETVLSNRTDRTSHFVSPGETIVSRRQGPLVATGNLLDVAIDGDGWMAIETPAGMGYTRDGRMQVAADGALMTVTGFAVLDAGGAPIQIDPSAGAIAIARDGMISQNNKQLGAIGLFGLAEDARLQRIEGSAVVSDRPGEAVLDFVANGVVQGYMENSNVNAVSEMVHLIEVSRAFEGLTRSITMREATLQNAIRTIGEAT
jgi:flagellar basal-body rod protein FlgF